MSDRLPNPQPTDAHSHDADTTTNANTSEQQEQPTGKPASRYGTRRKQVEGIPPEEQPRYVISVAAEILGVHPQTLRLYEREGLVEPRRSGGKIRLYSEFDINRVRCVMRLTNDLGVNLAGADAILNMRERMLQLREEMEQMRRRMEAELDAIRRELDLD